MKFKISFELDASGTSYSIKNKNDEVPLVLQNLALLFQELQTNPIKDKLDILASDREQGLKDALIEHKDEEIKIFSKLFDNWKVEGTMEDGKSFVFAHADPGYKEKLTFL